VFPVAQGTHEHKDNLYFTIYGIITTIVQYTLYNAKQWNIGLLNNVNLIKFK